MSRLIELFRGYATGMRSHGTVSQGFGGYALGPEHFDEAATQLEAMQAEIDRLNRECEQRVQATLIAQEQAMENGSVAARRGDLLEEALDWIGPSVDLYDRIQASLKGGE